MEKNAAVHVSKIVSLAIKHHFMRKLLLYEETIAITIHNMKLFGIQHLAICNKELKYEGTNDLSF